MSEKIGKLYTEAEVRETSRARAAEDKSHDVVSWFCGKCECVIETRVTQKLTDNQCKCGWWMQWFYGPFSARSARVA